MITLPMKRDQTLYHDILNLYLETDDARRCSTFCILPFLLQNIESSAVRFRSTGLNFFERHQGNIKSSRSTRAVENRGYSCVNILE